MRSLLLSAVALVAVMVSAGESQACWLFKKRCHRPAPLLFHGPFRCGPGCGAVEHGPAFVPAPVAPVTPSSPVPVVPPQKLPQPKKVGGEEGVSIIQQAGNCANGGCQRVVIIYRR